MVITSLVLMFVNMPRLWIITGFLSLFLYISSAIELKMEEKLVRKYVQEGRPIVVGDYMFLLYNSKEVLEKVDESVIALEGRGIKLKNETFSYM